MSKVMIVGASGQLGHELQRLLNEQNIAFDALTEKELDITDFGLKSIFETGFKRHSEPRLPSTAQINH